MQWLSTKTPLTITDIQAVENELNVQLPTDYKELIGPINGGALRNAYAQIPGIGDVPYSRNIPLDRSSKANVFELAKLLNPGAIRYFPFASVGNGDFFCFDLTHNSVVLYLHELGKVRFACNEFRQLLDALTSF